MVISVYKPCQETQTAHLFLMVPMCKGPSFHQENMPIKCISTSSSLLYRKTGVYLFFLLLIQNGSNEKRVNKQCLLNTPCSVTVYHKKYFGKKKTKKKCLRCHSCHFVKNYFVLNHISSCKCPMGLHHVGIISNCSFKNCGRSLIGR